MSNAFGFIQMRPGTRKQGYKRLLRGVRDEEVAGSNPVTPTIISGAEPNYRGRPIPVAPHVVNLFLSSSVCMGSMLHKVSPLLQHFSARSLQAAALKPTELIVFVVSVQGVLIASASPSCSGPAAALSRQRRGPSRVRDR